MGVIRLGIDAEVPDDLPGVDQQARDEAARAHERLDSLAPAAAYDDTALRAELDELRNRPDDDIDDEARERISTIEAKLAAPAPTPAPSGNDIRLADMPGSTDDERLAAAIAASKADPSRVIRLDHRDNGRTFTKTQTVHGGLRILGPAVGWQNPEQKVKPQVMMTANVGTGASSWLVGTATTFDVTVAGFTMKSDNGGSQFYHHPYSAGTCYAGYFADLTLYGFKHGFGMPGDAMSITLCEFAGCIQFPGIKDTALSFRGSDSWWTAKTNLDGNLGGGRYLVRLENLVKSHLEGLYLTARGATRALYNESPDTSGQGGTFVSGCIIEGHNAGDPAYGALVVNKSGVLHVERCAINFGMSNPGGVGSEGTEIDTALVVVLGGQVDVSHCTTNKATATPAASPFAHAAGGTLLVDAILAGTGGSTPVVRRTGTGKLNPPSFVEA